MREKNDLADGLGSGQEHDQTIDAHAHSAGRGHSVFKGLQKIFVDFVLLAARLLHETLALDHRIVQLRITRRDLLSVHDKFEHIEHRRIVRIGFGQRDQLFRAMRDETRIDRLFLDQLFEDVLGDLVVLEAMRDIEAQLDRTVAPSGHIPRKPAGLGLLDKITVARAAPGTLQVDHACHVPLGILVFDFQSAADAFGHAANQILDQLGHHFEIGVGPVSLEHGEFRIVPPRHALIAEVAVEFENLGESTDQQALQIQLRRYAQKKIHAQRIMMRFERRGRRAARHRLHHRCFHLEEAALLEKGTDLADDGETFAENIARMLVGDEVEVALAVPRLDVLQSVPLFRQRVQRLAQDDETRGLDRRLAGFRREALALDSDEIADIQLVVERRAGFPDRFVLQIDLHAPTMVAHVEKMALAHVAARGDTARDRDRFALGESRANIANVTRDGKRDAIGTQPLAFQGGALFQAHRGQTVHFTHRTAENAKRGPRAPDESVTTPRRPCCLRGRGNARRRGARCGRWSQRGFAPIPPR